MSINFKTTTSVPKSKNQSQNFNICDENVIDLSSMNLFEATQTIILLSTKSLQKNPNKKLKYKVSTPNIENLLSEYPITKMIEFV